MTVSFHILPGLPGEGPYPEQFTVGGGTHREGLVVRVELERGEPWVGNFQRGGGKLSCVFPHPNGRLVVVVSAGTAYPVDPETRRLGAPALNDGFDEWCATEERVVLASATSVTVLGPGDSVRRSPRLAWDGIKALRIAGHRLFAEGWDVLGDAWRPIEVDLESGEILATAYDPRPPVT